MCCFSTGVIFTRRGDVWLVVVCFAVFSGNILLSIEYFRVLLVIVGSCRFTIGKEIGIEHVDFSTGRVVCVFSKHMK